jgi:Flp pilus assembly protein TadG
VTGRTDASDRERGSVTLFAAVLALGLLLMTGLVIDGGAQLTAQRRATNTAEQAARAAAQAVDIASLRTSGTPLLHVARAEDAAHAFLTANGQPGGTVVVDERSVTVTVTESRPTLVLGLVGIHELTTIGTGQAQLLRGVTGGAA